GQRRGTTRSSSKETVAESTLPAAHCPLPTAQWRFTLGRTDDELAQLIRQDRIDILVDLAGHTTDNRLCMFARKPAPVQVTCFGYPNTTGLASMDYRLTDAYGDPPGMTDRYHSEELIRLPDVGWCYAPYASPDVAPLPAL